MKRRKHNEELTTLPEGYDRVMLVELRACAKEGAPLFARYGGSGMEPLLKGGRDRVCVKPMTADYEPRQLDVLAVGIDGRCQFRRFIRREGTMYVVRGDSCREEERIGREAIEGILEEVEHPDGSRIMCNSDAWVRRSVKAMRQQRAINGFKSLFEGKRGRYVAAAYFAVLLITMWLPLGGIAMDNLIFGLRPDHLFHASIYCFCAYFMWLLCGRKPMKAWRLGLIWLGSLATGVVTEFVQRLLPYRSFDVNDLLANAIGVTLGWMVLVGALSLSRKKGGCQ
ncbi:MAG: VanZ family protein [Bacteroidales bacterium]|nr:VanZ family protein [Bacteroidales bacterium]